jgi:hypothetical protein
MKKFAAILIIITSFLSLIVQFINFPEQFHYSEGIQMLNIFIWPISNIGFILLGFALLNEGNSSNPIQSEITVGQESLNPNDTASTGLNIISFLIPVVGLIIYLMEKDKAPKKANAAGKAAIWGVGISILLMVIAFIISFAVAQSLY